MTHPDILSTERYGYVRRQSKEESIGTCKLCGSDIFDGDEYVESYDGIFCDMDCCHGFYGIGEH